MDSEEAVVVSVRLVSAEPPTEAPFPLLDFFRSRYYAIRMKNDTEISKFLSFILRHQPEAIGLSLDVNGWADVETLLAQAHEHGHILDRETLERVVRTSEKKRFTMSEDGARIRAAQGHSLKTVDVQPQATVPPDVLYHGTAERFMPSIREEGLRAGKRQFVHLTTNLETALETGRRYGRPVLLTVDARAMHAEGYVFCVAGNGVWLTQEVPPRFVCGLLSR